MRLAICDDDAASRALIAEHVRAYMQANHTPEYTLQVFEHGEDLLDAVYRSGCYDVYLLDVVMPDMSGIELGSLLRTSDPDGRIIYLTSSRDYAVDAFRVRAFDYLLKPVLRETLFACLDACMAQGEKKDAGLIVRTGERSMRLNLKSILYAKLVRRSIVYHMADGQQIETPAIRIPFSQAVQELLRDRRFVLCGAAVIVNLSHITMVEKDALVFSNASTLYIPKSAVNKIRSAWADYWLEEDCRI